jgi:malonate-semialdehyde dehydrogenase (acetylating)/methylmalonate-semialdehyde dehydrogenase
MRDIDHFISGGAVAGASGRFGDVFDPNTGAVQARVQLATEAEVDRAVQAAHTAFAAWREVNPQRRARVMFEFKRLVEREMNALAEMLSAEHGKVIADSKGDIQRGLEVIEFSCGIPHALKGEYTIGAGPGIDVYSMRVPLGVCAGITPFNFPAMIPMWMFGTAIAAGNTFILKPSERDPSVPVRLAELMMEAGAPEGVLNVVHGDKAAVDAILTHPLIRAVSFVGSSDIAQYVYSTGTAHGKRVQAFGGAKNHGIVLPDADMEATVRDLVGAAYGSAGERCMALPVVVPVGQRTADELRERLVSEIETLKVGHSTDPEAQYGPVVTQQHRERVAGWIRRRWTKARSWSSTGGASRCRVGEGLLHRTDAARPCEAGDALLPRGDLRAGAATRAGQRLRGGVVAAHQAPVRQRRGHLHARRPRGARLRGTRRGRHGGHQCANPGARRLPQLRRLEALGLRRHQPARDGGRPLLDEDQDGHPALPRDRAGGRPHRQQLRHPDDALMARERHPRRPQKPLSYAAWWSSAW